MSPDERSVRPLRILVVSLGRRGGVAEYGWLMGRALAGHADVAVVCSALADNAHKWLRLDGALLGVRTFNSIGGMILSLFDVARFMRIRRFARSFEPDVIYYPGGHAWKPILDVLLSRGAKIVLTVHDPQLHSGEDSVLWRLLAWSNRLRVTGYVLLNSAQAGTYVERYRLDRTRVAVLPHGVFEDYALPGEGAASAAALLGLPASAVGRYLLFIGRIRPYKGLLTLLDAYAALDVVDRPALVVAGSGDLSAAEADRIRTLQPGAVHLLNRWLDDAEVAGLISAARFVVLPYLSATQTGVIPLASAFGVPAIASNTDGIAEQVVDGKTGLLVPPGDVRQLSLALKQAMEMSEEEYRSMSLQCRDHAASNWGWDGLAKRLVEFCRSL